MGLERPLAALVDLPDMAAMVAMVVTDLSPQLAQALGAPSGAREGISVSEALVAALEVPTVLAEQTAPATNQSC
jgi:hypothetical protein